MSQPDVDAVVGTPPDASDSIEASSRVSVVGGVDDARFPEMCACCGAIAGLDTLMVVKLFWRSNDDSSYYVTQGVKTPFCAECIRTHRRELPPVDPAVRKRLLRGWLVDSLPYFFPLGVCLWLLAAMAPRLVRAAASFRLQDPWDVVIWGAVCGFFGLMALMFYGLIRDKGRSLVFEASGVGSGGYVRYERGPLGSRFTIPCEPTSVLRAVDFTDDCSQAFEGERHLFTLRNPAVAERFAELNAGRAWDPASPRALWARTVRWVLAAAVILLGLYAFVTDLLH